MALILVLFLLINKKHMKNNANLVDLIVTSSKYLKRLDLKISNHPHNWNGNQNVAIFTCHTILRIIRIIEMSFSMNQAPLRISRRGLHAYVIFV